MAQCLREVAEKDAVGEPVFIEGRRLVEIHSLASKLHLQLHMQSPPPLIGEFETRRAMNGSEENEEVIVLAGPAAI
ncbi:hypothetical protein [Aminobacter sp. Piv2-1]|uniref:hypothetical protein n=1 Tax=Aminobacter sp. Piv2-1 TaxID=3031122 RepID=UPI0030A5C8B5